MKKVNKLLLTIFISVFSIGIFWGLESGFKLRKGDELFQSIIFGVSLFIALYSQFRKYLFIVAFILMGIMVLAYLFWQISWADRIGSVGFGIVLITIFSYTSHLVKKGHIEKL